MTNSIEKELLVQEDDILISDSDTEQDLNRNLAPILGKYYEYCFSTRKDKENKKHKLHFARIVDKTEPQLYLDVNDPGLLAQVIIENNVSSMEYGDQWLAVYRGEDKLYYSLHKRRNLSVYKCLSMAYGGQGYLKNIRPMVITYVF